MDRLGVIAVVLAVVLAVVQVPAPSVATVVPVP